MIHDGAAESGAGVSAEALPALRQLAAVLASARTPDQLCQHALEFFQKRFSADRAAVLLAGRDGALRVTVSAGLSKQYREALPRWSPWTAGTEAAAVILEKGTAGQAVPAELFGDGILQVVFVPLVLGRKTIGAVSVFYETVRRLTPLELTVAEALGLQTAFAIDGKRVEASLHARERMLAHFVEDAPIGLKLVEADGRVTWINQAEVAILGYSHEEYVGSHAADLCDDPGQRERFALAIENSQPTDNLEVRLRHRNGSIRHVLLSARPIWDDEHGHRTCWFMRDVTDRKRAETQQQFLLEASRILSSSLDYQQTLGHLTRLAVPSLADWTLLDMVEGDGGAVRSVAVAHVEREKEELLREMRQRYPVSPDGKVRAAYVLRTGVPMLVPHISSDLIEQYAVDDEHARLLHLLGPRTFIIVPLRWRGTVIGTLSWVRGPGGTPYDTEDLALAEELARRAVHAVEHARLYAEAQEANRLKDIFLANVSHELRTPLNAILGWTRTVESIMPADPPLRQAMETIARNAEVQARLINDLLDVSRIVSGKLKLVRAETDLAAVVEAAVDSVHPAADAKGQQIVVSSEAPGEVIVADRDRLQQVFWNLLANAVKFSDRHGRIEVRVRRAGGAVEISVGDHGCGIAPSFLPYLFERFRQADSPGRSHRGLGLGLAIVKHLVEMHGGEVWAESKGQGRGATFTVRLPCARGSGADASTAGGQDTRIGS